MRETLAKKLRVLRAERGITLDDAEELTGVTRETLGALEHAQRGAHASTLEKIARGYDVPMEYLVSDSPAVSLPKAGAPEPGRPPKEKGARRDTSPEEVLREALEEMRKAQEYIRNIYQYSQQYSQGMYGGSDELMRVIDQEAREFQHLLTEYLKKTWRERGAEKREGAEQT